jgi:hypothetical protein
MSRPGDWIMDDNLRGVVLMNASDNGSDEINADSFLPSEGIRHSGFIATEHSEILPQ